jgi:hypothetical protein
VNPTENYVIRQKFVESKPTILANENAACERCGSFDAHELAGIILCTDCITLAGCGCAGHGGDGGE